MDWKEKIKNHKLVVFTVAGLTALTILGSFAGNINSLLDLAKRDELTGVAGWLLNSYLQVTAWLSAPVTMPAWSLLAVVALAALAVRFLVRQRSQLAHLSEKLETLKNPGLVDLDSTEERVLFWVRNIYDSSSTGTGPTPLIVAKVADMPLTTVEAALDVLKSCGLIRLQRLRSHPLDLTAEGRRYLARPDVLSRYGQFQFNVVYRRS
ncbi:hypothetical protein [Pseudomonas putida]|uniref:Uncharacterized protein n=1 Tax=Pseudomonas putida TaxID=303 RepID=A0A8I1EK47_PSEPU|nr:hypothetical protein [Pseudomonas putida]MBI6888359.1 hypothetical protein [Pseudomonas putida]